jgi:hypothetical protein
VVTEDVPLDSEPLDELALSSPEPELEVPAVLVSPEPELLELVSSLVAELVSSVAAPELESPVSPLEEELVDPLGELEEELSLSVLAAELADFEPVALVLADWLPARFALAVRAGSCPDAICT